MASTALSTGWLRGKVKAVPSGDCLVIMGSAKADIPPEKTITLSSLIAPRLARRGGVDEPFAWESREFLRKYCIGKDVMFRVDYTVPSIGREFGTVFMGDKNVAFAVVSEGWAKVREQGQQKGEVSPYLADLQSLEEQAKQQGVGRWTKEPGASELAVRNLPPSAIGDPSNLDAMGLLAANKGKPMHGIVEQVRIVLEGVDKFSNLIGSVYYPDGDTARDLALELVQNGFAKHVEWSANMMENEAKHKLKAAELQAKKERLRIWTNYVPPASNSKAIHDQNFTGKVCVSSRAPKMGNPRREEKPAPYAREAKEFLRTRLIGNQVNVSMEYSRKVGSADGTNAAMSNSADSRVMDFGSVLLVKSEADDTTSPSTNQVGMNVAEMVVSRGFATVVRHRDFEERSNYYDALLAAESRAVNSRKGIHSSKDSPVMHITDLTTASAKKTRDFLPFLQRTKRHTAVVEYVLSGHRFKLLIPRETCTIAFSFSGVRCPGREEPFSEDAIALMRRKILQRDVEIEVETVDRTGTFLGSLWYSRTNMAITLLESGLARLQTSFSSDKIPDAHLLAQAEESAKRQKLKIWETYVEGQEVFSGRSAEAKHKEVLKVVVTEVLGGGKFYVQTVGDQKVTAIQQQLVALNIKEAPVIGSFNPAKGDIVLAQFSMDNSWNRAMIVSGPRGAVESPNDKFEVFYIDYGNREFLPYSHLRPLDPSVSAAPSLAQLCSLAYIKVPNLEDDFGQEAAEYLSELTLNNSKEFSAMIEEQDTSGGKSKGPGSGIVLMVTLTEGELSINAAMLQEGLAKLERKKKWDTRERKTTLDALEEFQAKAKKERLNIWQYGDVQSDDEELAPPPARKAGGRG
ncbi:hypothetical protein ZIOFF_071669 [Zingiber officinale]|uniref:Ribonuclease n=1 Tax=Zingiber officinale TaxID=94328 RepID=A0A8J5ENU1_ZINOF|nr:hypothetical protein ZIOFF_071669 [Zingiber officinale]